MVFLLLLYLMYTAHLCVIIASFVSLWFLINLLIYLAAYLQVCLINLFTYLEQTSPPAPPGELR